jgi:FAD/FMN-containing dehydrogenase
MTTMHPSYKTVLMTIPELLSWGDECLSAEPLKKADNRTNKEMVASLNNGKLYWSKPMVIPEVTGENYMATMEYCSQQMEKLAKMRGPVKTAWDNMQIKAWTKLRAEAAKSYLKTDRYHCMMEHIDALQWEIDGATAVGDKAECHRLIAKIEPLRKEIARIEKWSRDLNKLD